MLDYCLQLIFCYPLTMLAVWPVSALLGTLGLSGEHPSHIYFAGYRALLCLFVGPIVGWAVGRMSPSRVTVGRWLWLLPAVVLIPSIIHAMRTGPVPWLPEEFFITGDNEGLGVVFITLPACSAIGYSVGMVLAGMPGERAITYAIRPILRIALALVIGAALFVPCAALLSRFERAKMQSWSKVRSVIDPSGLRFSPDPNQLCAAPSSSALPLLQATVESLESRICGGGRLVETGAPLPRDSFQIERVKVLGGPNAGLEGWVPSYGLSRVQKP